MRGRRQQSRRSALDSCTSDAAANRRDPPSADEKALLAAAVKKSCSVSKGWVAERLQMGQAAPVSQFARRWQTQPRKTREIATLVSTFKPCPLQIGSLRSDSEIATDAGGETILKSSS